MADSVWQRYLVDGDKAAITTHLDAMTNLFTQWNDALDTSKGLYWREPLADATEYTISSIDASGGQDGFRGGEAFRPTINSYMWANAIAIANVAELAGQSSIASDYRAKAANIKSRFQADIWNSTLEHFIDRHQTSNEYVQYYQPIRGRELAGYVPWMFGMPDNNDKYNSAWKHLRDSNKFQGSNGLRTVEPSYEYYMRQYRYEGSRRECQWNGPVWPYQTTQVLYGMANLLNSYNQSLITKTDYLEELQTYTRLHTWNNKLNLEEDYEPDKRGPIVGLARSPHYFHSGYNDLIISGLVGLRPRADNTLEIHPLVPSSSSISYFRLQNLLYHGHNISIQWDSSGTKYNKGPGLRVEINEQVLATSPTLSRITAQLPSSQANVPAIQRSKISKSIQLQLGQQFPQGSASSNTDPSNLHDAIDGRIWFWSELPNGWSSSSTPSASTQHYTITFSAATSLTGCELAFYDDGSEFAVPADYEILRWENSSWMKIEGEGAFGERAVANGITNVRWRELRTERLRVQWRQEAGKRTRLVEFKAF